MGGWRPTIDQQRAVRWAVASVGVWSVQHIDADDLSQAALYALWHRRASDTPARVIAQSAVRGYLRHRLGAKGSARRTGGIATFRADYAAESDMALPMSLVDLDTPEALLALKQSVLGLAALPTLQAAVLHDLIFGADDVQTREAIARDHGCSTGLVDHARNNAIKIIALGSHAGPRKAEEQKQLVRDTRDAEQAETDVLTAQRLLDRSLPITEHMRAVLCGVVDMGGKHAAATGLGITLQSVKNAFAGARRLCQEIKPRAPRI